MDMCKDTNGDCIKWLEKYITIKWVQNDSVFFFEDQKKHKSRICSKEEIVKKFKPEIIFLCAPSDKIKFKKDYNKIKYEDLILNIYPNY